MPTTAPSVPSLPAEAPVVPASGPTSYPPPDSIRPTGTPSSDSPGIVSGAPTPSEPDFHLTEPAPTDSRKRERSRLAGPGKSPVEALAEADAATYGRCIVKAGKLDPVAQDFLCRRHPDGSAEYHHPQFARWFALPAEWADRVVWDKPEVPEPAPQSGPRPFNLAVCLRALDTACRQLNRYAENAGDAEERSDGWAVRPDADPRSREAVDLGRRLFELSNRIGLPTDAELEQDGTWQDADIRSAYAAITASEGGAPCQS